jgi:hypothetical protein
MSEGTNYCAVGRVLLAGGIERDVYEDANGRQ